LVKCSNCGAENPADAVFCEKCGARVTPMAATTSPPPPPAAPPAYPPAGPPAVGKQGPPMKLIAIAVAVIVIVLGGLLVVAGSATSGLKLSLQSGNVRTDYGLGSLTITMTLSIDNPSFLSVDVTNNYITIKFRGAGREAIFFSGLIHDLDGSYSGSTMKTIEIIIPFSEWYTTTDKFYIWYYAIYYGYTLELSIQGTLDTKCLFATGTTTVNVPYRTVTAW